MLTNAAWDSEHFGHPVSVLSVADVSEERLESTLDDAAKRGVRLIYWSTTANRSVSPALLRTYAGLRADRKATYRAASIPGLEPTQVEYRILEQPRGAAPPELLELAVTAGVYSRFRVDPLIPRERFEALYRTWMDRSTRGELADAVLIAAPGPAGVVTVRRRGEEGSIGLIAVAAGSRGKGIGRLLVESAHRWMLANGCSRASVVTQLDNVEACRLYERCGYHLAEVRDVYHFWPHVAAPEASGGREPPVVRPQQGAHAPRSPESTRGG